MYWFLVTLVLASIGCGDDRGRNANWSGLGRPHIVLAVADTLRADHVGPWGGPPGATPFLDELATRSIVFQDATSTSSQTVPSVLSIWSGLYPARHGNSFFPDTVSFRVPRARVRPRVAEAIPLLQESLREAGYATGAVVTNPWLERRYGFARGFEAYRLLHDPDDQVRGAEVNEAVSRLLDSAGGRPVFLYVHYMDAHPPFDPSPESRSQFVDGLAGEQLDPVNHSAGQLSPADIEYTHGLYAASVRDLDSPLQELVDLFEARELADRLLFVLLGDHGEEFAEHGGVGHGYQLYEESVRVPWLVFHADLGGLRIAEPTSGVDVMPTLLDLIGLPVPTDLDGRSQLRRILGSGHGEQRAIFSELGNRVAIRHGSFKWIAGSDERGAWFDLASDPGERMPRREPVPLALREARAALERARLPQDIGAEAVPLDDATAEQLRRLGYADDAVSE